MRSRIALWASLGFVVAVAWVLVSFVVPLSEHPGLFLFAKLTCPIVPVSGLFHHGVKWYWVVLSNFFVYALMGLLVEALWHSHYMSAAHQR
jgi:hypothetical protein